MSDACSAMELHRVVNLNQICYLSELENLLKRNPEQLLKILNLSQNNYGQKYISRCDVQGKAAPPGCGQSEYMLKIKKHFDLCTRKRQHP